MKSLFLRIFVLCWITNVVVIAAFMLLVTQTNLLPQPPDGPGFPGSHITIAGQAAVSILNHGGSQALNEYFENVERTTGSPVYVLNDAGKDVLDRPLPQPAERMAQQIRDGEYSKTLATSSGRWVGDSIYGPNAERFIVIGMLRRPPAAMLFRMPGPLAMPLLGIVVTAGVIAFVLAYHVTSPVRKLRTATQRFAAGDLAARVGPSVVKRSDAIGDLGREFDMMASRIESLITAQRRLLQDVSHELRSPLARLNVALGIASRRAGTDAKDALSRIEHEAEQLNELIGRLLTLSRLESSPLDVERSEFDVLTIVDEIAADADFEAQERGSKVRLIRRESCLVHGVEPLLRSAIENVLRNAISYTAPGTDVEVEISRRVEHGGPHAVLSVRDRGPGVPEKHLSSIFEPFHRVEDSRTPGRGGAGLGLAIAKRAALIHGGSIRASNAPEGGLIVELCIPAATCSSDSVSVGAE
jgi:two-component system sensor histidine kinase CpxA